MAGSSVTTTHVTLGNIRKLSFALVGDDTDGSFPATALPKIEGRLIELQTVPGASAPTDNWDVTILNALGLDVLQGVGVDRDTATTEAAPIVFSGTSLHPVVTLDDTLTLTPTGNSVNDALITIVLYYALGP